MKYLGIKLIIILFSLQLMAFTHVFDRIPKELIHSDYIFIVEIDTQTNYLFYKGTLIDQFSVSTGSKTRYKGNREMKEGVWRLGLRMDKDLAAIYGARLIYLEKYNFKQNNLLKQIKHFMEQMSHLILENQHQWAVFIILMKILLIYIHSYQKTHL